MNLFLTVPNFVHGKYDYWMAKFDISRACLLVTSEYLRISLHK